MQAQKCIPLVSAETPLTCARWHTTRSQGGRYIYWAEKGNLHKLGWIFRHGTVSAPRQCLHQTEATGMETHKCICLVGPETTLTCPGRQTTPSQGGRYRTENGNLRKLGWTCRHGTMFAPRQCLYQKEATGMESPEIYLRSGCREMEIREIRAYQYPWYHFCTKAMVISKGSYGYGELKNVLP